MSTIPPLFDHQEETAQFLTKNPRAFITSDPGTAKTRSVLEGFLRTRKPGDRLLALATLSILESAWLDDIRRFTPELTAGIAHGRKKEEVILDPRYDVVISNHDGIKWIAKDIKKFITNNPRPFTHMPVDEFTAFKNNNQRSKALRKVINTIPHRWFMSGTPTPNKSTDIWLPALLVDDGQRLGTQFFAFRHQMCVPTQTGPHPTHVEWVDKPGAIEMVADLLRDITIRHKLEDCIDMPEHVVTDIKINLPPDILRQYRELEKRSILQLKNGEVTGIHAGALATKLLQLMSGAVYDKDGAPLRVHTDRYQLVMDLVAEREHCLVAFNWQHEKTGLIEQAEKYGFTYAVIDGTVPASKRPKIVEQFQAGEIRVLFAHPQSASHGLTLTKGTTTIWCSPTQNAEHYEQFNHRIYRAGQKRRTETIRIAARGTREQRAYENLANKVNRQSSLLGLFTDFTKQTKEQIT